MADPTLQQLRYAVAVADARHFGRAAQACFVSQPALSAQIRELESRLGVQLFERSSRGVLLTRAGAEAIERARRILSDVDDLCDAAAGAAGGLTGPLRLGVIPTIAPYILPPAVRHIGDAHPDLELYLREDRTQPLLSQLLAGELDVLLLALPLHRVGVEELPLYEEPFLLAVPEAHPLAGRRRCDLDVLAAERLVLLEEGHCLRDQALAVCELAGHDGRAEILGTSLPTVVQMVHAGLGVTLLPESAVTRDIHPGESVALLELRPESPTRTVGLAWRTSSARGPAYRMLGELIAAAAKEAMPPRLARRRAASTR
jgi:LysR family hydrogen peroxide-inducible transcriptional activator